MGAAVHDDFHFRFLLDALGDDARSELVAETHDVSHQDLCTTIIGEIGDQSSIELHDLRLKVDDVLQVRVTRTEIIDRK